MTGLIRENAAIAVFLIAGGGLVIWLWRAVSNLDSYGCDDWSEDDEQEQR